MWQQLLKHREALLGGVIVLMVLAIGRPGAVIYRPRQPGGDV